MLISYFSERIHTIVLADAIDAKEELADLLELIKLQRNQAVPIGNKILFQR
jgi:hypothetical protein